MPVSTKFEEEVVRARAYNLNELRSRMNLSWLKYKDYKVITTKEEFRAALKEMRRYHLFAVDTETTGLNVFNLSPDNPIKDTIAGMSISWRRDQGIYIPFAHTRFDNLSRSYVLRELRHTLEEETIVTHNGLYDGKVFYDNGILLNIQHDTLLLYFNIDSNVSHGSKGLKHLTYKMYGYDVIEFDDIFKSSKDYGLFKFLDIDTVRAYACADSDHTLKLFMDSFKYLTPGQRNSYALDIRVQRELIRSEYNGKGVDMELCQTLNDVNNTDLSTLEDIIYRYSHYLICKTKGIPIKPGSYKFKIGSSSEVANLFYGLLGYKILKVSNDAEARPSVDKFVLKAMLDEKIDSMDDYETELVQSGLKSAIASCGFDWVRPGKDDDLIDLKEFKAYKYKLPYLIKLWRKLEKFRTSFFAPLLNNNFEGRYFSSISMTRTQTARLIDPIQTMVGYLKRLIVPYDPENEYLIDSDFAQIEYRCMAGLAHVGWLVERLRHPEADYHREGGSLILGKAPEDITHDERKNLKSVNFGIPYKMSANGVLENRYGIGVSKEDKEIYLVEIEELLAKWHASLYQISDMLNDCRDDALKVIPEIDLPEPLKGHRVGRVTNPLGRTRVFFLEKSNGEPFENSDVESIRRQAGNFPIQSFAREVYCMALLNLCARLKKEGLMDIRVPDDRYPLGYRLDNKVVIQAYIHDEFLMNVHKSVNPNDMQRYILEECMLELEGHPNYYCGVNVIHNWYEGKSDIYEAPVRYVQEIAEKIKTGTNQPYDPECVQRDWVLEQIREFYVRRTAEEFDALDSSILENRFLDVDKHVPKFKNYHVKPKMDDFFGLWRKPVSKKFEDSDSEKNPWSAELRDKYGINKYDDYTASLMETYLIRKFGEVTVRYPDGMTVTLKGKPGFADKPKVTYNKESAEDRELKMVELEDTLRDEESREELGNLNGKNQETLDDTHLFDSTESSQANEGIDKLFAEVAKDYMQTSVLRLD